MAEAALQQTACERRDGKVKWFNNQKGFGFIVWDDHTDVFVHHSAISMEGYRTLTEGELVTYELAEGPKGLQAKNVMPVHQPTLA